jgi:hypothetical protein
VFESAVDGFGWAVAGSGPVEVCQDVAGPCLQRAAQCDELAQGFGDAAAEGVDHGLHHRAALGPVGFAVGSDGALIDRPGGFNLDMGVGGEQGVQPGLLFVGEQVGAGV